MLTSAGSLDPCACVQCMGLGGCQIGDRCSRCSAKRSDRPESTTRLCVPDPLSARCRAALMPLAQGAVLGKVDPSSADFARMAAEAARTIPGAQAIESVPAASPCGPYLVFSLVRYTSGWHAVVILEGLGSCSSGAVLCCRPYSPAQTVFPVFISYSWGRKMRRLFWPQAVLPALQPHSALHLPYSAVG